MCVGSLKVNLGPDLFMCGVDWMKKNCCVQKIDLVGVDGVFHADAIVVCVKCVNKCREEIEIVGPDAENVVQKAEINSGF